VNQRSLKTFKIIFAVFFLTIGGVFTTGWFINTIRVRKKIEQLHQEIEDLRSQIPPPSGGTEVAIPEFKPTLIWDVPLAKGSWREVTSLWGWRVSPLLNIWMHHPAVDLSSTQGAQVVSVAAGVVVVHYPPPDDWYKGHDVCGAMIEILHTDGMLTRYCHMSETWVHEGDRVQARQPIGRVGDTGKAVGSHLHFEVETQAGELVNPLLYIKLPGANNES